jgi:hypothetical protein
MDYQFGNWYWFVGLHSRSLYIRVWRVCVSVSAEHSSGRILDIYPCD